MDTLTANADMAKENKIAGDTLLAMSNRGARLCVIAVANPETGEVIVRALGVDAANPIVRENIARGIYEHIIASGN